MNIGGMGSTYNRTYTPYQSNKNVKYFAGYMQNEDGSFTQKTAEEDGKGFVGKFMDYQEFHKLWMSQNGANRMNFHFGNSVSVDESIEEDSGDKKDMPEEEETRTEIVVRPDGSRVLMITVTVGGQEAVTSVELAKPTGGDIPSMDIALPEAGQVEECEDKSIEASDAEQLPLAENKIEKVTEVEVVSLHNGVSFYYNCDTGELQCINHNDDRPGRHALWSKTLTYEDWERCCDEMLDRYVDRAAGQFVYRYQAYLRHEEFWDMYLDGKVDLRALTEKDDALSEEELYDQFLRDMANHEK